MVRIQKWKPIKVFFLEFTKKEKKIMELSFLFRSNFIVLIPKVYIP